MTGIKAGFGFPGLEENSKAREADYEEGEDVQMLITVTDAQGEAYATFSRFTVQKKRMNDQGYWEYQLADSRCVENVVHSRGCEANAWVEVDL